MTVLLILIPAALLLGAVGLAAFLWALRTGQFDDLDGAAVRILEDEDPFMEIELRPAIGTPAEGWNPRNPLRRIKASGRR
jgi:cbb3-type cytochrome oxidase maturation protein